MTLGKQIILSSIVFILGFMLITIGLTSNEVVRAKFYGDFLKTNNTIEESLDNKQNSLIDKQEELAEKENKVGQIDSTLEKPKLLSESYTFIVEGKYYNFLNEDNDYKLTYCISSKDDFEKFISGNFNRIYKTEEYQTKLTYSEEAKFNLFFYKSLEECKFEFSLYLDEELTSFEKLYENYTGYYWCNSYLTITNDEEGNSYFKIENYLEKYILPQSQN